MVREQGWQHLADAAALHLCCAASRWAAQAQAVEHARSCMGWVLQRMHCMHVWRLQEEGSQELGSLVPRVWCESSRGPEREGLMGCVSLRSLCVSAMLPPAWAALIPSNSRSSFESMVGLAADLQHSCHALQGLKLIQLLPVQGLMSLDHGAPVEDVAFLPSGECPCSSTASRPPCRADQVCTVISRTL